MGKSRLNLTIDSELYSRAVHLRSKYGVNLSTVCEQALLLLVQEFDALEHSLADISQSSLTKESLKAQMSTHIDQRFSDLHEQADAFRREAHDELLE